MPVYEYTIGMGDPQRSTIYYYATDARPPGSMAAKGPKFLAFKTRQPGTAPVYMYYIPSAAPGGTLVYYFSVKATTPTSFRAGGVKFYAYPSARKDAAPVYLHTASSGDRARTQLYHYSSSATPPQGFTNRGPAFYVPRQDAPRPDVPVYEYTIHMADPQRSSIYYYSTNPRTPTSFTKHGTKFRAFATPQPGTAPVYSFTIPSADPGGTLVYYLSRNRTPPRGMRAGGAAFHAYPSARPGTAPVYVYTRRSGDRVGTQLYHFSTGGPPAGFRRGAAAFYVPSDSAPTRPTAQPAPPPPPPPSAPPPTSLAKSVSGRGWQLHMGLTGGEHQALFTRLSRDGWAMEDIGLHFERDAVRHTSLWRKAPRGNWIGHHGLDEATFRRLQAQRSGEGYHLHDLAVTHTPLGSRVAGIWRQGRRQQTVTFGHRTLAGNDIARIAGYADAAGRPLYAVVRGEGPAAAVAISLDGGAYQRAWRSHGNARRMLDQPLIERAGRGIRYGGSFRAGGPQMPPSNHGLDWSGLTSNVKSYPDGPAAFAVAYVNDRPWFHVRWAITKPQIIGRLETSELKADPKLAPVFAAVPATGFSASARHAQADVRLFGLPMTLYVWLPEGSNTPNLAVLADRVQLSQLVAAASGTVMDELRVKNAAFLYVPKANAGRIDVASLPEPVRRRVAITRTGAIELVAGQNAFGQIHLANDGDVMQGLQDAGICAGSAKTQQCFDRFHVHLAHGKTKQRRQKTFLRIAHPTKWATPFGLEGLDLERATLEFVSVANRRNRKKQTLRAWGTTTVAATRPNTPASSYFLFGQCVLKACKVQNAFAFNGRRMSLDGLKDIANAIGAAVFDRADFTTQHRQSFVGGLNQLPLQLVRVENSSYNATKNETADGNPDFNRTMLVLAATQHQRLPYTQGNSFRGPRIKAYGELVTFERTAASGTADVAKRGGRVSLEASGRVAGFEWGKVDMSDGLRFSVKRVSSRGATESYAMSFAGKLDVDGFGAAQATIEADNSGFDFEIDGKCPLQPFGVSASMSKNLGTASSAQLGQGTWSISKLELNCPLPDIAREILKHLPKEFGVPSQVGAFTDSLLAEFSYRTAFLEPIRGHAGDLNRWRNEVSGVLNRDGISYISPAGEVFGRAAGGGISTVQSVFGRSDISGGVYNGGKSAVESGNRVASEIGGWLGLRGTVLSNPAVMNQFDCAAAPNVSRRAADLMNLRRLRLETSGPLRSAPAKPGAAYGCVDRVVPGGPQGAWLRLDLGPQTGPNGELFHVAAVTVSTSGGTAQDRYGGLEGAVVIFSNEASLRGALADRDLVYRVDSDELRYRRAHSLGANEHHYIVEEGQCIAQTTPQWRDSDYLSGHRHEPATQSRYVYIYQPRANTPIRINHLAVMGRNVTGRNNLCACVYVRGPANTGALDKGTNQPEQCWN